MVINPFYLLECGGMLCTRISTPVTMDTALHVFGILKTYKLENDFNQPRSWLRWLTCLKAGLQRFIIYGYHVVSDKRTGSWSVPVPMNRLICTPYLVSLPVYSSLDRPVLISKKCRPYKEHWSALGASKALTCLQQCRQYQSNYSKFNGVCYWLPQHHGTRTYFTWFTNVYEFRVHCFRCFQMALEMLVLKNIKSCLQPLIDLTGLHDATRSCHLV